MSTPSRQATAEAEGRSSSSVWTVAPRMAPSAEWADMRTSCHRARSMISHWFAQLDPPPVPRPALPGSRDADVCIVGAGFTGLWTAYELRRADPSLDVLVLEAEVAGFGASGRNGGWVVGELAGKPETWEARGGHEGLLAQAAAIQATVDEVGAAVEREGIACDFAKGGSLHVAQTPLQLERMHAHFEEEREWGLAQAAGTELLDA